MKIDTEKFQIHLVPRRGQGRLESDKCTSVYAMLPGRAGFGRGAWHGEVPAQCWSLQQRAGLPAVRSLVLLSLGEL